MKEAIKGAAFALLAVPTLFIIGHVTTLTLLLVVGGAA